MFPRTFRHLVAIGLIALHGSLTITGCGSSANKALEERTKGDQAFQAGNLSEAMSRYERALEHAERAARKKDATIDVAEYRARIDRVNQAYADQKIARGDELLRSGKPGEAESAYREALDLARKAHGDTARIEALIAGAQRAVVDKTLAEGDSLRTAGQHESALQVYARARELAARIGADLAPIDGRIAGTRREAGLAALKEGDEAMARRQPVSALFAYARARRHADAAGIDVGDLDVRTARATRLAAQVSREEGDGHLGADRPLAAYDAYAAGRRYAADAGLPTAPYDEGIARARAKAAEETRRMLERARGQLDSSPESVESQLSELKRWAGYAESRVIDEQIAALEDSPQLRRLRAAREMADAAPGLMDTVTRSINDWLFSRSMYTGDLTTYEGYFRLQSYLEIFNTISSLDARLSAWEAAGVSDASTARRQLAVMKASFEAWRLVASQSLRPTEAQGLLLIRFLETHIELKARLRGSVDINYYNLSSSWGVSGTGSGGFRWEPPSSWGTGDGNAGTGSGTGTGTGSGDGGAGTGPGTGTGTSGSGTGSAGTGTGSGSGTGTGTGTGSSVGTGTGTGRRGTGTGTADRDDPMGDLNRTSTGGGTSSGGTSGTGTGSGSGSGSGTGTGTSSGAGARSGTGAGTGSGTGSGSGSGTGTGTGTGTGGRRTGTGN
jgi:tetratricopeptide (TPR) repeat protein